MRILVVDDSEMMRGIVMGAIQENAPNTGHEFFEAADGQEALELLNSKTIDLVLLDWNMPRLDGLAFVKQVREDGYKSPIIMITAVTDQDKILEAGSAGVNSYLEKPVRGPELWAQIKRYVI